MNLKTFPILVAAVAVAAAPIAAAATVPVIQISHPFLSSVTSTGLDAPGSTVTGIECTKFDGEPDWTCIDMNDFAPVDPVLNPEFLRNEMYFGNFNDDASGRERWLYWQSSAPTGVAADPTVYAVEYQCGAWRHIQVASKDSAGLAGAVPATCASPILANETFVWTGAVTNAKAAKTALKTVTKAAKKAAK